MAFDLGNPKDYFRIPGRMREFRPLKIGHIHDTWVSWWDNNGEVKAYIHQKVNVNIFQDIDGLMKNMSAVVQHVRQKIIERNSSDRIFHIVPTMDDALYYDFGDGVVWRTLEYLENTESFFICETPEAAYEAASCCARFIDYLSDLDPNNLIETIPDFHNPRKRFEKLLQAIAEDPARRVVQAKKEIDFALNNQEYTYQILDARLRGELPIRVTHNDLKFNNVLFDRSFHKAIAVVDLDTCMPGTIADDWGDFIRNTCVNASEDEVDLERVFIDQKLFDAATRGFLNVWKKKLSPREIDLLPIAPAVLALTLGVRFLTDFLLGDIYFKTHHSMHNLDRARTQFKVFESISTSEPAMRKIFENYLA